MGHITVSIIQASSNFLEHASCNQREMNTTVNNLTSKVTKLELELKQSQRKCEQLEAQSRRENLRLYGLEERPNETWEE